MPAEARSPRSSPAAGRPAGSWRFVPREEALKRCRPPKAWPRSSPACRAILCRTPSSSPRAIAQPEPLERLGKTIAGWPKVAHVQLDSAWVKRFDALLRLGKLVVMLLAGILRAGALVTVTFNTIRLQILAQAAEIEVADGSAPPTPTSSGPFTISARCRALSAACSPPCWSVPPFTCSPGRSASWLPSMAVPSAWGRRWRSRSVRWPASAPSSAGWGPSYPSASRCGSLTSPINRLAHGHAEAGISRRDFLRTVGAAALAGCAPSGTPALPPGDLLGMSHALGHRLREGISRRPRKPARPGY